MSGMLAQPHTHDVFGWFVVAIGAIVTLATIAMAVYWTVRPGEQDPRHPKYLIFKDGR